MDIVRKPSHHPLQMLYPWVDGLIHTVSVSWQAIFLGFGICDNFWYISRIFDNVNIPEYYSYHFGALPVIAAGYNENETSLL